MTPLERLHRLRSSTIHLYRGALRRIDVPLIRARRASTRWTAALRARTGHLRNAAGGSGRRRVRTGIAGIAGIARMVGIAGMARMTRRARAIRFQRMVPQRQVLAAVVALIGLALVGAGVDTLATGGGAARRVRTIGMSKVTDQHDSTDRTRTATGPPGHHRATGPRTRQHPAGSRHATTRGPDAARTMPDRAHSKGGHPSAGARKPAGHPNSQPADGHQKSGRQAPQGSGGHATKGHGSHHRNASHRATRKHHGHHRHHGISRHSGARHHARHPDAGHHGKHARRHHAARGHHRHGHHHAHRSAWTLPVHNYTVTSRFGPRWGTNHPGIDLAIGTGLPVHAAHAGTVAIAGWDGGYGNGVEINVGHGIRTVYGHNSRVVVWPGQHVRRGQLIAYSGSTGDSTGPHCHFELRRWGVPFDPVPYLRARGLDLIAHSS